LGIANITRKLSAINESDINSLRLVILFRYRHNYKSSFARINGSGLSFLMIRII
jgi:hypothetical protein